jgi:hypothetical protein
MERQLLSRDFLIYKIVSVLICAFLLIVSLDLGIYHNFGPPWLLIFIPTSLYSYVLLFGAFKKIHPVYYDDDNLYWIKKGKQQVVPYNSIESFAIIWGANSHGTMKYHDERNEIRSIRFYLNKSSLFATEDILKEFQRHVQAKKPDFKVITKGFFGEHEL